MASICRPGLTWDPTVGFSRHQTRCRRRLDPMGSPTTQASPLRFAVPRGCQKWLEEGVSGILRSCLASRGPVWRRPVPRVKRTTVSLELLCRRVFALPGPLPEGSPPPQVFVQKSPSQWGRLWSLHLQPSCLPSLLYFLTVIYHHLRRWVLPGFCFWASACPH